MDSITQIVLGAAMGEIALGKKVGNKAMLWGGVAGTIPDLDVISEFFISEINSLAFHRGFTHSILFSFLGAFLFGWLVYQMYKSPYYKWIAFLLKFVGLSLALVALSFGLSSRLGRDPTFALILSGVIIVGMTVIWVNQYFMKQTVALSGTLKEWQWLFFLGLFTHPILDCFTTYGTQLFSPFSDYRVAFSTISVADPLYTVPFIICLVIASFMNRKSKKRRTFTWLGIGISCAYLLFTVFNKQYINQQFRNALNDQNLSYSRMITNPSILNNVLWSCTAESDNEYWQGYYSLFDKEEVKFNRIPKNHEFLDYKKDDHVINTLRWFSSDYWNAMKLDNSRFQISDLRFGTFMGDVDDPGDFIFRFVVSEVGDGQFELLSSEGGPPKGKENKIFSELRKRIFGESLN